MAELQRIAVKIIRLWKIIRLSSGLWNNILLVNGEERCNLHVMRDGMTIQMPHIVVCAPCPLPPPPLIVWKWCALIIIRAMQAERCFSQSLRHVFRTQVSEVTIPVHQTTQRWLNIHFQISEWFRSACWGERPLSFYKKFRRKVLLHNTRLRR